MNMINNFFTSVFFLLFAVTSPTTNTLKIDPPVKKAETETETTATAGVSKVQALYNSLNANSFTLPEFECFAKAVNGYNKLKSQGKIKKEMLTVIDFSKSSNTKRLWIIDMNTNTVLYNTLVSHGRNSGNEFATTFSNEASSNKSSLGFYATGELYKGKHGESLRLDGLEKGINNNARARAIVMHAADYVCDNFIKQNHRLGRSLGCPALPNKLNKEIINLIQGKSCLFIYHPTEKYIAASQLVKGDGTTI
jgi:hypothetical protein